VVEQCKLYGNWYASAPEQFLGSETDYL